MSSRKRRFRFLLAVPIACLALAAAGIVYLTPAQPMAEALESLQSSSAVTVASGDNLLFSTAIDDPAVGVIFYPGALVDPRAYAPLGRTLASRGYLVYITPMPLNLAVLAPRRAAAIIDSNPQITAWVIGGHSLGGAMAAQFVATQPQQVMGLFLLASYPPQNISLEGLEIGVICIYGDRDLLATPAEILGAGARLPAGAEFVRIEGGNHAQFGWYGEQAGDGRPFITRAEQQALTETAILMWMAQFEANERPTIRGSG